MRVAHRRLMQLPVSARWNVFRDILSFFEYIASQRYVTIYFFRKENCDHIRSGENEIVIYDRKCRCW